MSTIHEISVDLVTKYSDESMLRILENSTRQGWVYYDYIFGELYQDAPIIDHHGAFERFKNFRLNDEEHYSFYLKLPHGGFGFLDFRNEEDCLEVSIGAFSYTKIILFDEIEYIDYAYYTMELLMVCGDFPVQKLSTLSY